MALGTSYFPCMRCVTLSPFYSPYIPPQELRIRHNPGNSPYFSLFYFFEFPLIASSVTPGVGTTCPPNKFPIQECPRPPCNVLSSIRATQTPPPSSSVYERMAYLLRVSRHQLKTLYSHHSSYYQVSVHLVRLWRRSEGKSKAPFVVMFHFGDKNIMLHQL